MAYDFHYTPTGTGVISGKEVLEQTEDAINDLGNTAISGVQEALDKAEQALTNSENAVDDAQTALNTANNAEGVAIQAQTDVGNLSGTVTNIGNRVTTAEGNITNLQGRMTTAEGNITNLQGRMTTAETNIGNLQTAVSTAQATANSAQQTATTARQQSYVFRYSSTALVASSTNSNTLLDNTDNLKVGDKVIDSSGVLFSITAIDTVNSTFTIGTALIDLAQDSDVVHKSGNETVGGVKTFSDNPLIGNNNTNITISNRQITANSSYSAPTGSSYSFMQLKAIVNYADSSPSIDATVGLSIQENAYSDGKRAGFNPNSNNTINLGLAGKRWANVYATNYYYGGSEIEFSTKFVTTDTNQTIGGVKTFSDSPLIYNSNSSASIPQISLKNQKVVKSSTTETGAQLIYFADKNNQGLGQIEVRVVSNGATGLNFTAYGLDSNNQNISTGVQILRSPTTANFAPNADNAVTCGRPLAKWSDVQTYKVNGVEPSSLSLPTDNINDIIDISSYLSVLDGSNANTYVAPANGWISITMSSCSGIQAYITGLWGHQIVRPTVGGVRFFMPILKNKTVNILIFGGTIDNARFIPCQGNV